jgi:hypothetical protein
MVSFFQIVQTVGSLALDWHRHILTIKNLLEGKMKVHAALALFIAHTCISSAWASDNCIQNESQKVCVGDAVISNTRVFHVLDFNLLFSTIGMEDPYSPTVIASKVVSIKNGQIFVERGSGGPAPHNLDSVIPIASLRDQDACTHGESIELCGCDSFSANGRKWTAVAGLNKGQTKALNFPFGRTGRYSRRQKRVRSQENC